MSTCAVDNLRLWEMLPQEQFWVFFMPSPWTQFLFYLHDSVCRTLDKKIEDAVVIEVSGSWLAATHLVTCGRINFTFFFFSQLINAATLSQHQTPGYSVFQCCIGLQTCEWDLRWMSILCACPCASALTASWVRTPAPSRSCWSSGWRQCPGCCGCFQNQPREGTSSPQAELHWKGEEISLTYIYGNCLINQWINHDLLITNKGSIRHAKNRACTKILAGLSPFL